MSTEDVTDRQKEYEQGCRDIARDLEIMILLLPLPTCLLALGHLTDLFGCIRTAYTNGRVDEAESSKEI